MLASEVGVLDLDPATVVRKGRLQPGRMFLVDTDRGRIVDDAEIKAELAAEAPYDEWLHAGQIHLDDLPEREHVVHTPGQRHPAPADLRLHRGGAAHPAHADGPRRRRADRLDGHRHPDRRAVAAAPAAVRLLQPAVRAGDQPAAGRDPRGARHLARHARSAPSSNLLDATPAHCRQVVLPFPVIDNDELAKIVHINRDGDLPGFAAQPHPRPLPGGRRRRGAAGAARARSARR